MRTLLIGLAAAATLTLAATGTAGTPTAKSLAVKSCASLRTSLGPQTFAMTFGTRPRDASAFGVCVSRFTPTARAALRSARAACAGQTGKAFTRCVRTRTHASLMNTVTSVKNAALACKSQLRSLGSVSFEKQFGVNHNLANAFGKCVSSRVSNATPAQTKPGATTTPTNFKVTLLAVNGSGAGGTAHLTLSGDRLRVDVSATGLEKNQLHPLFIGSGSSCPTTSADTNADGVVQLSEGQLAFGASLLNLTPVPTASVAGKVRFDRVYTVNSATLKPLRDRTLVVQGMTVKGTYDQTVPVACGEISS